MPQDPFLIALAQLEQIFVRFGERLKTEAKNNPDPLQMRALVSLRWGLDTLLRTLDSDSIKVIQALRTKIGSGETAEQLQAQILEQNDWLQLKDAEIQQFLEQITALKQEAEDLKSQRDGAIKQVQDNQSELTRLQTKDVNSEETIAQLQQRLEALPSADAAQTPEALPDEMPAPEVVDPVLDPDE